MVQFMMSTTIFQAMMSYTVVDFNSSTFILQKMSFWSCGVSCFQDYLSWRGSVSPAVITARTFPYLTFGPWRFDISSGDLICSTRVTQVSRHFQTAVRDQITSLPLICSWDCHAITSSFGHTRSIKFKRLSRLFFSSRSIDEALLSRFFNSSLICNRSLISRTSAPFIVVTFFSELPYDTS